MKKIDRMHLERKFDKYSVEDWLDKDNWEGLIPLEIEDEVGKGKGLIARRKFEVNDTIGFYRGKRLTEAEYMKKHQVGENEYIFVNKENKLYIDATEDENCLARYINDSNNEKPNARTKIYTDRSGRKHIQIVCCREIDVGDEIHYDYKGEYMPWRVTQNVKRTAQKQTVTPPTPDVSESIFSVGEVPTSTAPPDDMEKPPFMKLGPKMSKTVNFDVQGPPRLHLEESPLSTVTSRDCVSIATTNDNEKQLGSPKPFFLSKDFRTTTKKPKTTGRPPIKNEHTGLIQCSSRHVISNEDVFNPLKSTSFHCLACGLPFRLAEEIQEHRFRCEKRKTDYPEGQLAAERSGKDQYLLCMCCLGMGCKSTYITFKKHVLEESGHFDSADWMVVEYEREARYDSSKSSKKPDTISKKTESDDDTQSSSDEEEEERSKSKDTSTKTRTINGLYRCRKCPNKDFTRAPNLLRHLRVEHNLKSMPKKDLNALHKMQLLQNKNEVENLNEKRYFCTHENCKQLYQRPRQHNSSHQDFRIIVRKFTDLPEFISEKFKPLDNQSSELHEFNRPGLDFSSMLTEFKQSKLIENELNEQITFTHQNIDGKIRKLSDCIKQTNGFRDLTKIKDWLNSYPGVVNKASSKQNLLGDLQKFVKFVQLKLGGDESKLACSLIEKTIQDRFKALNRVSKIEKTLYIEREAKKLPSMKELELLRKEIVQFLEAALTGQKASDQDFRTIQHNLIALLIISNGARAGTIYRLHQDYLNRMTYDNETRVYTFELLPSEFGNDGEEKTDVELAREMSQSHKNFKFEGKKFLSLLQNEKEFLEVYLYMRELKGQQNEKFLFCPTGLQDPSLYQLESRTKNYQRTIQNQYNIESFDSNKVRKILNSYWAENISDPRQIRSIDQAMGHSRGVASMHYEVARDKAKNSAHMTLLINKDLSKFSEQPRAIEHAEQLGPSLNIEQPGANQEAAVTSAAMEILEEETDDEMQDETFEIGEVERENEEVDGNGGSKDETMSLDYRESCSSQEQDAAVNSLPTAGKIALFIKNRPQRSTAKYTLNTAGRLYLAKLYRKKRMGTKFSLRAAITQPEDNEIQMTLDQARAIFEQIDRWISQGAPSIW